MRLRPGGADVEQLAGEVSVVRYVASTPMWRRFRGGRDIEVEGIDYGPIREVDMAMLRHAMVPGVEDTDFSKFYIDDDAP